MNVRHQMLLAAINRHGRYVERHRASKAQAAQRSNGAADYWREVVKFSAVNCRAWLSMAQEKQALKKPLGVLHVTNSDINDPARVSVESP